LTPLVSPESEALLHRSRLVAKELTTAFLLHAK
jgi:hypothetical protein